MKANHIIPIIYMHGTGGSFLSTLISHARENKVITLNNDKTNTHGLSLDNSTGFNINQDPLYLCKELLKKFENNTKIVYPNVHINNVSIALNHFEFVIKTSFTRRYDYEISCLLAEKLKAKLLPKWMEVCRNKFPEVINVYTSPRVLDISYKRLQYDSVELLIEEISNFTSIPKDRFDKKFILNWREVNSKILQKYNL